MEINFILITKMASMDITLILRGVLIHSALLKVEFKQ